jgi:cyanophycinase
MHPAYRWLTLLLLAVLAAGLLASPAASQAQETPEPLLVPIGGGYADVYPGLVRAILSRAQGGLVRLLVLPTTYSSNAEQITPGERQVNLTDAERRRFELQEACKRAAPPGVTCEAVIAPIFTRLDAQDPANLADFTPDLAAVFILGGDQAVAMRALANTPVEQALAQAYQRGAVISGTSAGCGLLSAAMIADYSPNFAPENALDFGSALLWNTAELHGMAFGVPTALLDQHFFQRGRVGRLLEAIARPGAPGIGVGVDAYTGVHIAGGQRLEQVFGLYSVAVLDAETYHAAESVRYSGPRHTLSLRNVLVHLLSPGPASFDLAARRHSLVAWQPRLERDPAPLALPQGAGALILAGGLEGTLSTSPVLARFSELAGGQAARVLVYVEGYPNLRSNQRAADRYAAALQAPSLTLTPDEQGAVQPPPADAYTAILYAGRDQSLMTAPDWIKQAWLSGKPLLADNAAAAVTGAAYSAHGPTPDEAEDRELATQKSFQLGQTVIRPGLGLLEMQVEPQLMSDVRWGRWFSLAYANPQRLTLGLNESMGVEITAQGAQVIGESVLWSLDLRAASLDLGTNDGFVIANGLIDIFSPGETVAFRAADAAARFERQPTPVLAAPSASPTASPAPQPSPTLPPIPKPTLTPPAAVQASPAASPAALAPAADQPSSGWPVRLLLGGLLILGAWLWARRRR